MVRGILLGRWMISGALTTTVFATRALSKLGYHQFDFFINPVVVFAMFLTAGLVMLYPFLKGIKALIITPLLVFIIAVFVYAYYIL